MKIKSVATVGALGVGLGIASFIGGTGAASADQCGQTPIGLTPSNILCNVRAQGSSFAMSVSPARNLGILVYGEKDADGNPSGLGLVDQLSTFQASVQDFLSGPRSPDAPSEPATPAAPAAPPA